jgi:hypothetical protein
MSHEGDVLRSCGDVKFPKIPPQFSPWSQTIMHELEKYLSGSRTSLPFWMIEP